MAVPQPPQVDALRDELLDLYRQAWEDIEAQLVDLATDPAAARTPVQRQRLTGLGRSVEEAMADLDGRTRSWLQGRYPAIYQLGGDTTSAATGREFRWTQIHRDAIQALASDTFTDLLSATRFVRRTTKQFIREAARARTRASLVQGVTAKQAGRDLASILRDRFDTERLPHAVRYRNGARHGLADYADTVLRTKTAEAFNAGTLNAAGQAGVGWFEVFDGYDCGWTSHDDPDKAAGTIRSADECAAHSISHPRCARSFGPRPDVATANAARDGDRFTADERDRLAAEERGRVARHRSRPRPTSRRARERQAARRPQRKQDRSTAVPQVGVPARAAISQMPGQGTRVGRGVQDSLDQIEKVHRIPDGLPRVPVKPSQARGAFGSYEYDRLKSMPVAIRIRTSGDHIAGTFAHEFGHYLDHQANLIGQAAQGAKATFGTSPVARREPLMQAFFDAVEASPTKQALAQAAQAKVGNAAYYNSHVEVWARAYHQWIATRSGSAAMLQEVAVIRAKSGAVGLSQWGDDEFKPIASALDAIFRARGLMQ